MKRYGAVFALFGFGASVVIALWGDAPLEAVLRVAFLWAITFGVIGIFLGHTASVLLSGGGIADLGDERAEIDDGPRRPEDDEPGSRVPDSRGADLDRPESGQSTTSQRSENTPAFTEKPTEKRSSGPIQTDEVE